MSRDRRRKIKQELPETSTSFSRQQTEHDLAYYIHDRVELMHQVFSILKPKDLKAMAPECVRHISTKDLQELCTEELLGISSKRLLSILDGAEPPSDTESSSASPQLETISLDSISSDEEILSQSSKKKKHKHRRRDSKTKSKKKKSSSDPPGAAGGAEGGVTARAGLTVLELLELQARARAIRAQLQQDKSTTEPAAVSLARSSRPSRSSSDSEVVIKEEPAEVVVLTSSDDEKPDVGQLRAALVAATSKQPESTEQPATITKKVNDLTITVPQSKQTRKIKLNRNKMTVSVPNETNKEPSRTVTETIEATQNGKNKKKKKKQKKNNTDKDNSDHDEITLQLSDSEKMDLLEDFDRKQYDVVTSSSSEDSESSSDDSDDQADDDAKNGDTTGSNVKSNTTDKTAEVSNDGNSGESDLSKEMSSKDISLDANVVGLAVLEVEDLSVYDKSNKSDTDVNNTDVAVSDVNVKDITVSIDKETENVETSIVVDSVEDIPVIDESVPDNTEHQVQKEQANSENTQVSEDVDKDVIQSDVTHDKVQDSSLEKASDSVKDNSPKVADVDKKDEKSEGEMSDRESSGVEACDLRPEVVCISDDDGNKKKKKKKKEKKSKKSKKSKKKDFCEASDQNFYKDATNGAKQTTIDLDDDDDVYEILEILSDDSSCYEVEGTVLSKEPTAKEIEALSAKIDEIEKQEVVDIQVIDDTESVEQASRDRHSESSEDVENISWKDRYLGSKKVKRVLSTANILNALRKKNKELKKKIEESKKAEAVVETETAPEEVKEIETKSLEEGSIEHYNTLEGSTKFVDPVKETADKTEDGEENKTENGENVEIEPMQITGEMKKDAKQLLKMYKRLLKQCKAKGEEKKKDPNKKKKKKKNKSNKETGDVSNSVVT